MRSIWWLLDDEGGGEGDDVAGGAGEDAPASKQRWKTVTARSVGLPMRGCSSMPATRPRLRMSMTLGRPRREWTASSK